MTQTPGNSADRLTTVLPSMTEDEWYALLFARGVAEYSADALKGNDGDEYFRAVAKTFARLDARDYERSLAALTSHATFMAPATGTITVLYPVLDEDIQLDAGTVMFQTRWGAQYAIVDPLVWVAASGGAPVVLNVEARWAGRQSNMDAVSAAYQTAAGTYQFALPQPGYPTDQLVGVGIDYLIDLIARGDVSIVEASEIAGGSDGELELIATGHGVPRQANETEDDVRLRIWNLNNGSAYDDIAASINAYVARHGITVSIAHAADFGDEWGEFAWSHSAWFGMFCFVVLVPRPDGFTDQQMEELLLGVQQVINGSVAGGYFGVALEQVDQARWTFSAMMESPTQFATGIVADMADRWYAAWVKCDGFSVAELIAIQQDSGPSHAVRLIRDGDVLRVEVVDTALDVQTSNGVAMNDDGTAGASWYLVAFWYAADGNVTMYVRSARSSLVSVVGAFSGFPAPSGTGQFKIGGTDLRLNIGQFAMFSGQSPTSSELTRLASAKGLPRSDWADMDRIIESWVMEDGVVNVNDYDVTGEVNGTVLKFLDNPDIEGDAPT